VKKGTRKKGFLATARGVRLKRIDDSSQGTRVKRRDRINGLKIDVRQTLEVDPDLAQVKPPIVSVNTLDSTFMAKCVGKSILELLASIVGNGIRDNPGFLKSRKQIVFGSKVESGSEKIHDILIRLEVGITAWSNGGKTGRMLRPFVGPKPIVVTISA